MRVVAEFCLDCWNRINGTHDPADRYLLSKNLSLCEGCGKATHVIVAIRGHHFPNGLRRGVGLLKFVYGDLHGKRKKIRKIKRVKP